MKNYFTLPNHNLQKATNIVRLLLYQYFCDPRYDLFLKEFECDWQ